MGTHRLILPNITIGDVTVIRGSPVLSRNISPGTLWGIPSTEPIAIVSVLLTQENTNDEFIKALLPIKKE